MRQLPRPLALIVLAATLVALPLDGSAQTGGKKDSKKAAASKKKGGTVGDIAESQKDPQRQNLDEALRLARKEDYAAAAIALYDIVESATSLKDEAQYNLAKNLYRLGLYHSALSYFTDLISKGPSNTYYSASLEWCLFISRKIVGDQRVHEAVASFSSGDFPKEYKDEFHFYLAKYHYQRALAIENESSAALGETRVREKSMGGKSFKGDIFGDDGDGGGAGAPGEKSAIPVSGKEEKVTKKAGGGISIDEDIFGTGGGDEDKPKQEEKKESKKEKGKKGRKGKEKQEEAKKEEPPPKKEEPAVADGNGNGTKKKKGDLGGDLTAKEHITQAQKDIQLVDSSSRFGPRAKFLEGLILYKQGRENDALEAFKSVVRLTKAGQPYADPKLRELAFFQLARTHFGAKQPSFSIFYYDKVDRDSYAWLDAIYESSWADFRLGKFDKALGNLLTLHSPFFKDEYYPESHILKAVIYYENCHYPEAKQILGEFTKRYEPVEAELVKMTERDQAPAKYYEILSNLRGNDLSKDQERSAILGQILQIALADKELKRLDASYREVNNELGSFAGKGAGFGQSRLASHLTDTLGNVRDSLAKDAGRAVKRTLEAQRDAIKLLIQQSVRIDIETSRAEQERIEGTLQGIQSGPSVRDKEFIEWADDEKIVWPFTGEYWRDELGTYEVTLANSCKTGSSVQ